jgi:hypothetical protein
MDFDICTNADELFAEAEKAWLNIPRAEVDNLVDNFAGRLRAVTLLYWQA